jgi:hypothetical protein
MSNHRQWEAKMLPGIWKDAVNVELEKHAREGWELVTVLSGKEDRRELYFKRPLIRREPESAPPRESQKFKFAEDLKTAFREGLQED